jgi:multiple antibiotic resistance protein
MLEEFLFRFTSLLFVVDPWGAIPAFLVMTAGDSPQRRRMTAVKATLIATFVLMAFALGGSALLKMLGITMPAFRIAGGVVLFLVAFDMIRAQRPSQQSPGEIEEGRVKEDVAITPLAIPMLAGPASLGTVILLAGQAGTPGEIAGVYLAIALVSLVSLAVLLFAASFFHRMGSSGINVLSRVLGLLLTAIAVQFIIDGLADAGFAVRGR